MTSVSGRLQSLRDRVTALRMGISYRLQRETESEPESDEDSRENTLGPPAEIDLERVPSLIESADRESMNRAVGWLLTAPSVPEAIAADAFEACLRRTEDDQFTTKRLAYRGIAAIHEHHPETVEAELPDLVAGLSDRFVVVQEACADVLIDLFRLSPGRVAAVYPLLRAERTANRSAAMDVVLGVAQQHPVILASLDPFFREQLQEPTIDRTEIVEAYLLRRRREPAVFAAAMPTLLGWLPTTDRELENVIVNALTAWGEVPEADPERVIRTVLLYIGGGDRPHRSGACQWLVDAIEADPTVRTMVEAWQVDTDEWERLRVVAAIDEATEEGLERVGQTILQPDDTFMDHLGAGVATDGTDPNRV